MPSRSRSNVKEDLYVREAGGALFGGRSSLMGRKSAIDVVGLDWGPEYVPRSVRRSEEPFAGVRRSSTMAARKGVITLFGLMTASRPWEEDIVLIGAGRREPLACSDS